MAATFITLLFLSGGCYTTGGYLTKTDTAKYVVKETTDKFEGYTTYRMEENRVQSKYNIDFNLQKFKEGATVLYSLIIEYVESDWLFIQDGTSLKLIIDGKDKMELSTIEQPKRDTFTTSYNAYVVETAHYRITKKQILKIASATTVEAKLIGRDYYTNASFTAQNITNFKRFYDEYVEPKKITTTAK